MKVIVRKLEGKVCIRIDDKDWLHIRGDARVEFFKRLEIKGKAVIEPYVNKKEE